MFYRTKFEPKFKVTNKQLKVQNERQKIISINEVRVQLSNIFFKNNVKAES